MLKDFKEHIQKDLEKLLKDNKIFKDEIESLNRKNKEQQKKIFNDFLEILDAFEGVFHSITPKLEKTDKQTKIWIGNFKTIKRMIENLLKSNNIVEIDTIGMKINPKYHYVLDSRTIENIENDIIIEVKRKGYLWKNEILRLSEVIISKKN